MESMWFAYGFLFIFGTIIGSFLNAALFRFNTGRTLSGRSSCVSCGETLSPRDLVPLLSFLFLRGRCRSCKSRISPQYPLVEFAAGILATQCYRLFPDDALFFTLSFLSWMVLLFIMVYDMRHKIIPDFFSILLGAIVLCGIFISGNITGGAILAGPLLALPFFIIHFVSRGRAMGLGDGKLMLGVGWLLGLSQGFVALLLTVWIGGALGLALLFLPLNSEGRRLTMKSEIPYAPFLIMGAAIAYFTNVAPFLLEALFPAGLESWF